MRVRMSGVKSGMYGGGAGEGGSVTSVVQEREGDDATSQHATRSSCGCR